MTPVRPAISAIVITNENADRIGACLESLRWVDEIVVVDDFSADGTPDLCRRLGAKVVPNRFVDFREQKSLAMSLAANDWVLEIDSDERVSDAMRESILRLTPGDFARHAGFAFPRRTRFWGKWLRFGSMYPDWKERLYDRRRGAWSEGSVHERFVLRGPAKRLPGPILHEQDLDLAEYVARTARYATLSAGDQFLRGKRASWHHVTVRPVYTFVYRYVLRLGVLDGIQGVVVSAMGAVGTFLKYLRLYELQRGYAPPAADATRAGEPGR